MKIFDSTTIDMQLFAGHELLKRVINKYTLKNSMAKRLYLEKYRTSRVS